MSPDPPNPQLMRRVGDVYIAHTALVIGDVQLAAGVNLWFNVIIRGDGSNGAPGTHIFYQTSFGVWTDFNATTATGDTGEVRAIEIPGHRFYIATLFQPQLSSTEETPHPIVLGFLGCAAGLDAAA